MTAEHQIGFDIHKNVVVYEAKMMDGTVVDRGSILARRAELRGWAESRTAPWVGAMEATLFTGWIYDFLKPYAKELKVAHPFALKAISSAKKKDDRIDAAMIADLLRCNLLPECYIAPPEIRDPRRILRYRTMIVRLATKMKNKAAGLLMECGAEYEKKRLHGKKYYKELLDNLDYVPESVIDLLRMTRTNLEMFTSLQKGLQNELVHHPQIRRRVQLLTTIQGVGDITALTWALEIGDPRRFGRIGQAISYCGLCSALNRSAGKDKRGPLSKQRNKHLQAVLIEAAKLAPRWNPGLKAVQQREQSRGNRNRATLAVARKLVGYLLAVDKAGKPFETRVNDIAPEA